MSPDARHQQHLFPELVDHRASSLAGLIRHAMGLSAVAHDIMAARFGLTAEASFHLSDAWPAFYLVPAALIANLVPALRLYRNSINDGIMVRR